ncbi:hypothetical protein ACJIZ3_022174 [Penstemon smallii]|uniref:Ribonucleotide reductase large subunit domain-containing protein n=1 Tax=Penstemon smallii TaxID=265156 RepID=A0ABD3SNH9_9LAMI
MLSVVNSTPGLLTTQSSIFKKTQIQSAHNVGLLRTAHLFLRIPKQRSITFLKIREPVKTSFKILNNNTIFTYRKTTPPIAQQLNKDIFETIYYHALKASCELAEKEGTYETYTGSPVSKGILQPDMWGVKPSDRWDWDALRAMIAKNGVRNSLLVAPMPTASTSQILGNMNVLSHTPRTFSAVGPGDFVVVNKHLLYDLIEMGLWSLVLKNRIIFDNGSVQKTEIPDRLKTIYKTVWEIKQRIIVDMAADRGSFIDQSQSLNIHMDEADDKLTSLHFYAWSRGLKTGMYYLRSRAAADAIKFTVDKTLIKDKKQKTAVEADDEKSEMACSLTNRWHFSSSASTAVFCFLSCN